MLLLPSKFFEKKYIFFFLFLFCAISTDRLDAFTKTASVEIAERRAENSTTPKENVQMKKRKENNVVEKPEQFSESSIELGPRNDAESVRARSIGSTRARPRGRWQESKNRSSTL